MQEKNPISVTCPECHAAPEAKCTFKVRDGSKFMDDFHPERGRKRTLKGVIEELCPGAYERNRLPSRQPSAESPRIPMTIEQEAAIMNKWKQSQQDMSLDAFLNSVQPTIGCDGAVTVKWSGMWLCIEKDGHTHS